MFDAKLTSWLTGFQSHCLPRQPKHLPRLNLLNHENNDNKMEIICAMAGYARLDFGSYNAVRHGSNSRSKTV